MSYVQDFLNIGNKLYLIKQKQMLVRKHCRLTFHYLLNIGYSI